MDDDRIAQELHAALAPLTAVARRRLRPNPQVKEAILQEILRTPREPNVPHKK